MFTQVLTRTAVISACLLPALPAIGQGGVGGGGGGLSVSSLILEGVTDDEVSWFDEVDCLIYIF